MKVKDSIERTQNAFYISYTVLFKLHFFVSVSRRPVLCVGLFSSSHMKYRLDQRRDGDEPALADMTEKAIRILRRGNNGYFLLVEGYWTCHCDLYVNIRDQT